MLQSRTARAEVYHFLRRLGPEYIGISLGFLEKHFGISSGCVKHWRNDHVDYFPDITLSDQRYDEMFSDFRNAYTLEYMPYLLAVEITRRVRDHLGGGVVKRRHVNRMLSAHTDRDINFTQRQLRYWSLGHGLPTFNPKPVNKALRDVEFDVLETEITALYWKQHVTQKFARESKGRVDHGSLSKMLVESKTRTWEWIQYNRLPAFVKVFCDKDLVAELLHLVRVGQTRRAQEIVDQTKTIGPVVRTAATFLENLQTGGIQNPGSILTGFVRSKIENADDYVVSVATDYANKYMKALNSV